MYNTFPIYQTRSFCVRKAWTKQDNSLWVCYGTFIVRQTAMDSKIRVSLFLCSSYLSLYIYKTLKYSHPFNICLKPKHILTNLQSFYSNINSSENFVSFRLHWKLLIFSLSVFSTSSLLSDLLWSRLKVNVCLLLIMSTITFVMNIS